MSYLENLPSYNKDSFSLYEPYNPENRKPVKTLTLCPKQKPEQVCLEIIRGVFFLFKAI